MLKQAEFGVPVSQTKDVWVALFPFTFMRNEGALFPTPFFPLEAKTVRF